MMRDDFSIEVGLHYSRRSALTGLLEERQVTLSRHRACASSAYVVGSFLRHLPPMKHKLILPPGFLYCNVRKDPRKQRLTCYLRRTSDELYLQVSIGNKRVTSRKPSRNCCLLGVFNPCILLSVLPYRLTLRISASAYRQNCTGTHHNNDGSFPCDPSRTGVADPAI